MKRAAWSLVAALFVAGTIQPVWADDLEDNFKVNLNQPAIDALTKDVGSVLGGGSFHTGKALGFPVGFDIGVHAVAVGVRDENVILKDDTDLVGAAYAQAEVGLPARINVIGRYGSVGDADIYGGGLRVGLLKSSVPGIPSISLSGLYTTLDHEFVVVETYSVNAALSFDLPIVHPYVGAGYDMTSLEVQDKAYEGVPAGIPRGIDSEESGYRVEAGVNLSIIPFTYITLAAGLANGQEMYHAGLGVNF
jgi:hypothetical protein